MGVAAEVAGRTRTVRRGAARGARTLAVLGALAAVLLVGCGEGSPGAAATVDGEPIALDKVDAMARAYCAAELAAAEQGQQVQVRTTGQYRNLVLSALVNAELAEQARAALGLDVPPAAYEQDLGAYDPLFEALSAEEEDALREYISTVSKLQATVEAIGRRVEGGGRPSALVGAGQRYLERAARRADIELDPRFGQLTRGQVVGGSGSLSVPVPTGGDDAGSEEPTASVPASQTCR